MEKDYRALYTELEAERSAQAYDQDLFDTQRLQIEFATIEHFRLP